MKEYKLSLADAVSKTIALETSLIDCKLCHETPVPRLSSVAAVTDRSKNGTPKISNHANIVDGHIPGANHSALPPSQDVRHAINWAISLLCASLLVGPHTRKQMQSRILRRNPLAVSRMSTTLSMPAPDMMVTVRRVSPLH